ncbi:TSC1 family protein [Megaselia abdita]
MCENIEKLFKNLESNDENESNEARSELTSVFQKTKENWLVHGLMEYYARNPKSSRVIDVLVKAHSPHENFVFDKLCDWLKTQNRLTALNIFALIIHKQPTWLGSVCKHKFFKELLKALQNDNDIVFLMNGLLCIITLLPIIPPEVHQFLNDLFEIFNSLAAIKYKDSDHLAKERSMHLNLGLKMFFDLLYGMFPCNFLNHIKETSKKDNNQLSSVIRPLLESVKIHPLLVLSDPETELKKIRWNKKEPHDVVSECDNLSITYLAYCADQKDSLYMDITNDFLAIENSTPLPAVQKFTKTDFLSPTSRLLSPNNTIWSPLNVISQKSPLITSAPSTAQNTPLPVPLSAFHATNIKNTPNNMLIISGTSPPEAAVEATPESTPLKELDQISFQPGNKKTLAVRAILNKTGGEGDLPSHIPPTTYSTKMAQMFLHRNEAEQRLSTVDISSYEQQAVCPARNRFLSERDSKVDFSEYFYKEPSPPKISENITSSKSCPDLNALAVALPKFDSVFKHTTVSTQTSDCSLSNKLITLIEENNRLKREQMLLTPLDISQTSSREILNEYIDKIAKIDAFKQPARSVNDMKEQLQLLNVQLRYERYRRDMHAERNRRLMGRSRDKRTLEMENKKLREQLDSQNMNYPDQCRSYNKQLDSKLLDENKFLKQKHKEQSDLINQMKMKNDELQEKFNTEMRNRKEDKEKIDQLNGEVFELRHDLEQSQVHISLGKKYKEDLTRLEGELLMMGEIQLKCREKLLELDSIRVRDEEYKIMERAYINEVKELKTSLEEKKAQLERAKHKSNDLQTQNNNKEQAFTDQKRNLKSVKDSYEERLKALSNKYEVQKTIILQMEQSMFELSKNTSSKCILSPESDKIDFASSVEKSSPLSTSLASSEGMSMTVTDLQSIVENSSRSNLQTSPLKSTVSKILPSTSFNNKGSTNM